MKIVVNKCFGGFSISVEAAKYMASKGSVQAQTELNNWKAECAKKPEEEHKYIWHGFGHVDGIAGGYDRTDPLLVEAVEILGEKANGDLAKLKIVNVPDDVDWEISEYDGIETVREKSRSW